VEADDQEASLRAAKEQVALRQQLDNGSDGAKVSWAMAEGQLARAYILRRMYDKPIDHCDLSIQVESETEEMKTGAWFPHFTTMRKSACLLMLCRPDEALALIQNLLDFRERALGDEDGDTCR